MEPTYKPTTFFDVFGVPILAILTVVAVYLLIGSISGGVRRARVLRAGWKDQKVINDEVAFYFIFWFVPMIAWLVSFPMNAAEWATFKIIGRPEEPPPPPKDDKPEC